MNKRKFKVGDRVFSEYYGEGTVISIDSAFKCPDGYSYPIQVDFNRNLINRIQYYRNNGQYYQEEPDQEEDIVLLHSRKTKRFKTII